jgi:lysophospholipase L1-like esterase
MHAPRPRPRASLNRRLASVLLVISCGLQSAATGVATAQTTPAEMPPPAPAPAQIPLRVAAPTGAPAPMPIISRGAPAFAPGGGGSPGSGNDGDFRTQWGTLGVPAWLAYDLSGVAAGRRGRVVVAWYGGEGTVYDAATLGRGAPGVPAAYAIEANAAPGGAEPPAAGWVTLAEVTGNTYHSRQHVVDLSGHNWVRILVTEAGMPDGGVGLNLDVHDAGRGVQDAWIFYGDSITAGAMQAAPIGSIGTYSQLISVRVPTHSPAQESGGISGLRSGDGARLIDTWLAAFPGRYVGLSYGTNDAKGGVSPEAFYSNYEGMVRAVVAAGKVPVIPKVPWGRAGYLLANAPAFNAKLDELYAAYPIIVPGPDLWAYFREHRNLIARDGVHPTPAGYAAYRLQWADTMAQRVYHRE